MAATPNRTTAGCWLPFRDNIFDHPSLQLLRDLGRKQRAKKDSPISFTFLGGNDYFQMSFAVRTLATRSYDDIF